MIDWITAKVPLKHTKIANNGGFIKYDKDGSIVFDVENKQNVEGSASSTVQVASDSGSIYFSGNPAKFLQGHNLTGIDNPYRLTKLFLLDLQKKGITSFNFFELDEALNNADIFRVDINFSFGLKNNFDVEIFLQTLHYKSRTRHGKATMTGDTCYFGKHSKRWSIKFYNKYRELQTAKEQKRLKNLSAEHYNLLMNSSKNIVRAELTLRTTELAEMQFRKTNIKDNGLKLHIKNTTNYDNTNYKKLKNWNNDTMAKEIFDNYLNRLEISGQLKLTDETMLQLPMNLRATYLMWRDGYVLTPKINIAEATYYRHKKQLKNFGIDISIPRDTENEHNANVVEFKRVLSAEPVNFVDEFKKYGLVAH